MASKAIGEKMKKKEPAGDSDSLEESLIAGLASLRLVPALWVRTVLLLFRSIIHALGTGICC
jgi:hypothetical protein